MRRALRNPAFYWLAAAMLVGVFTRFWNLTLHSLFIDEGFTFMVARKPLPDMLQFLAHYDFHPPLFYVVTHYLMSWLHWPLWDYRYFTAPFGLLTIVATWGLTRRMFGDTAAGIAALLVALEPGLVDFDRLYRMYAVQVGVSALSWWLLLIAADKKHRRWLWWAAYGASAVILPYLQYLGALTPVCQGLYALTRRQRLWPALACEILAAVALLPWAWAIHIQYPVGGLTVRLSGLQFSWPAAFRYTLAEGLPVEWLVRPHFDLYYMAAVGAILVGAVWIGRRTALPFWLLPALLQAIASIALHKDLAIPRFLYFTVPAVAASVGAVAAALLRSRARVAGIALALTVLSLGLLEVYDVVFVPLYQTSDWYAVSLLLAEKERPSDVIALVQGAPVWIVRDLRGFRRHPIISPALPSDVKPTIQWLDRKATRRVWYIENQYYFTDPRQVIKAHLARTRRRLGEWFEARAENADSVYIALYGPFRTAPGRTKSVVKTTSL